MKPFLFTVSAICLLTTMLFSCHKHEELQTQSVYTFINTTGKRITFDIYGSKEDYDQNANRAAQYLIEPGAVQKIEFDVAKTYWIDWYNQDFTANNWQSNRTTYNQNPPAPQLVIAALDDTRYLQAGTVTDTTRSVLLNGGGTSTTWLATISHTSNLNGTHKFIFRKDFSGDYTYTDESGTGITASFDYSITGSTIEGGHQQGFSIGMTSNEPRLGTARCNPGRNTYPHTGRDTMLVRFYQPGGFEEYPIVRQ